MISAGNIDMVVLFLLYQGFEVAKQPRTVLVGAKIKKNALYKPNRYTNLTHRFTSPVPLYCQLSYFMGPRWNRKSLL
jgi:hypothetical protein